MEAWRSFRRHSGFFATAIVLLASGITAVSVMFAVADALLLRPLAAREPERLVRFVSVKPQLGTRSSFRLAMADAWRDNSTAFESMGVAAEASAAFRDGGQWMRAQVSIASPDWLSTFGVTPAMGSLLADERSAVLSHGFWKRHYNGRTDALGRSVEIHGQPFTIAGVLPAGFTGSTVESGPDVWIPLAAQQRYANDPVLGAGEVDFEVAARLKPDVSREAAREQAYRIFTLNRNSNDLDLTPQEFDLEPLQYGASRLRTQAAGAVWFATAAAGLLALMVCVNLSGLILARVIGREREFAVRQALGASRWRLAGLVLGEVLFVCSVAASLGAVFTVAGLRAVSTVLPPVRLLGRNQVPMALRLDPDLRVLGFACAFCIVALCLIALVPVVQASRAAGFAEGLRQTRGSASHAGRRWLLAVQVALCTMLLFAAALVRGSLTQLREQTPGAQTVICDIDSLLVPGIKPERFARAMEQWKKKVDALPGVQRSALSSIRRLRGSGYKMTVVPAGEKAQPAQFMNTSTLPAGEGYLETTGIALLAGRQITRAERYSDGKVRAVVVNETFARQYGGPQAVLGRQFGPGRPDQPAEAAMVVVGVAANVVYRSMRESAAPVIYSTLGSNWNPITLTVRTDLPAAALAAPLRETLREVEPQLVIEDIADLRQDVEASLWNERAVALVSTVFASLAAAIVAAGLFAFAAHLVASRRREAGIRMAIGATPAQIARLVLNQGLWPVGIGLAAGLVTGLSFSRLSQGFLFRIRPENPVTVAAVAVATLAIGTLACAVPAWRASRISPSEALRAE